MAGAAISDLEPILLLLDEAVAVNLVDVAVNLDDVPQCEQANGILDRFQVGVVLGFGVGFLGFVRGDELDGVIG